MAEVSPEYFHIEKEKPSYQDLIDEARAKAIAEGNWKFFEERKRGN